VLLGAVSILISASTSLYYVHYTS